MATPTTELELPSPPFVVVEGGKNFRDIGGYPITGSDSKSVKRGFVYRSANLGNITDNGRKTLVSPLGIRVIFDLRRPDEGKCEQIPGCVTIHTPILGCLLPRLLSSNYMVNVYSNILAAGAFRRVFEHVRDNPDEPFLIHCALGKDRTGVLAALMLRIAGVSDLNIIREYELTDILVGNHTSMKSPEDRHETSLALGKHMKASMVWLDETYGGTEDYFKDVLKFQDEDIRKIKKNLVVQEKPILTFSENGVCLMKRSLSFKAWCTKLKAPFLASVFFPLAIFFCCCSLGLFRGERETRT